MRNEQSYSHGLLYSVAPENIPSLHLLDDEKGQGDFDWLAYESQLASPTIVRELLNFLRELTARN